MIPNKVCWSVCINAVNINRITVFALGCGSDLVLSWQQKTPSSASGLACYHRAHLVQSSHRQPTDKVRTEMSNYEILQITVEQWSLYCWFQGSFSQALWLSPHTSCAWLCEHLDKHQVSGQVSSEPGPAASAPWCLCPPLHCRPAGQASEHTERASEGELYHKGY